MRTIGNIARKHEHLIEQSESSTGRETHISILLIFLRFVKQCRLSPYPSPRTASINYFPLLTNDEAEPPQGDDSPDVVGPGADAPTTTRNLRMSTPVGPRPRRLGSVGP